MKIDARSLGEFRIYASAVEPARGAGYTARLVVHRVDPVDGGRDETFRGDRLDNDHRWESSDGALRFALDKAREVIAASRAQAARVT